MVCCSNQSPYLQRHEHRRRTSLRVNSPFAFVSRVVCLAVCLRGFPARIPAERRPRACKRRSRRPSMCLFMNVTNLQQCSPITKRQRTCRGEPPFVPAAFRTNPRRAIIISRSLSSRSVSMAIPSASSLAALSLASDHFGVRSALLWLSPFKWACSSRPVNRPALLLQPALPTFERDTPVAQAGRSRRRGTITSDRFRGRKLVRSGRYSKRFFGAFLPGRNACRSLLRPPVWRAFLAIMARAMPLRSVRGGSGARPAAEKSAATAPA
jgi:hypothetical protein